MKIIDQRSMAGQSANSVNYSSSNKIITFLHRIMQIILNQKWEISEEKVSFSHNYGYDYSGLKSGWKCDYR